MNRTSFIPKQDEVFIEMKNLKYDNREKWSLVNFDGLVLAEYSREQWETDFKNFPVSEIACRGTGYLKIARRIMTALQEARDEYGPITVTSGTRTVEHNKKIGGAPLSMHTKFCAIDVSIHNQNPLALKQFFTARGFRGFKLNRKKSYLHMDIGPVWVEGFDKITANDSRKFASEGKTDRKEKREKQAISGAAILGAAPSVVNSVADLNLPIWFIMGAITVGAIVAGVIWWRSNNDN